MDSYKQETKRVLKTLLKEMGLKSSGTKVELIKRLVKAKTTTTDRTEPEPNPNRTETTEPEPKLADTETEIDVESASQISSSSSFVRTQRAMEAAKRAEFEARARLLDERQKLLREELNLKLKQEQLDIEEEIMASKARENSFAQSDALDKIISLSHEDQLSCPRPEPILNLSSDSSCDKSGDRVGKSEACINQYDIQIKNLTETVIRQQNRSLLPKTELTKFAGDPMEYPMFIRSFISQIENQTENSVERLHFLHQSTTGKAQEIVKGYMYLDPDRGYRHAREALDRKYGDQYRISHAYVDKILSWPQIKAFDINGLENFAILIRSCRNAMESIGALSEVNHPKNLQKIVGKLPFQLQEQWRQFNFSISRQNRTANFEDIVEFVEQKVQVAIDPVFGVAEMTPTKQSYGHASKSTFLTSTTDSDIRCFACDECHDIESCPGMLQMDMASRIQKIKEKRLCFACLRPNHISKDCKRRMQCRECNRKHPTMLHVDFKPASRTYVPRNDQTGNRTDVALQDKPKICSGVRSQGSGTVLPVLPVQISVSGRAPVQTYAFLDNGSQSTFITENLRRKLRQDGQETSLTITTVEHTAKPIKSRIVMGLHISDIDGKNIISLPPAYTVANIPVGEDDIANNDLKKRWPYLHLDIPEVNAEEIGILIGCDCPKAMEPWDIIHSQHGGPYALKTCLGWTVVGPKEITECENRTTSVKVNRVRTKADKLEEMMVKIFNSDFTEKAYATNKYEDMSYEDKLWKTKVEKSIILKDGKYEIALPFKAENVKLPNNKVMAERRAMGLRKKLERDPALHKRYSQYMAGLLEKGHAEPVTRSFSPDEGKVWYIPHHSVQHPAKPDKTRVVFDGSAKYCGTSLNSQLLQGPNLANTLVGVLVRFRKEKVAFMADIQEMFYQVRVPKSDFNFLRFLWWPEGDTSKELQEFVMKKHIFGSVSSPGCANFALKKCARDNFNFSAEAARTIEHSFYIDDCLKSVDGIEEAVKLVGELKKMCAKGGFNLTKFVSNQRQVTESLPDCDKTERMVNAELGCDTMTERALGVLWDFQRDKFKFKVRSQQKPLTRRGILSATSSFFDPLGFAAPVLMVPKLILQELCRLKLDWDDIIPTPLQKMWLQWDSSLHDLERFSVERCMKPPDFGRVVNVQIHHFADASQSGYGAVSYLRQVDENGKIHCAFLIGKARVAPLKSITIPRMELTAATVAVRLSMTLKEELKTEVNSVTFWTDSTTVLRYIKSKTGRFHTYVANRVSYILENSEEKHWKYVKSKLNPADEASRGTSVNKFLSESRWTCGPEFLWLPESDWPEQPLDDINEVTENDPELKKSKLLSYTSTEIKPTDKLLQHYSDWYKLKRAVAYYVRLRHILQNRIMNDKKREVKIISESLTVEEIRDAETQIVKYIQVSHFPEESVLMSSRENKQIKKRSSLYRLDPVCKNGVLRVGGRLSQSYTSESRHPAILPSKSHVTDLIILDAHRKIGHSGRLHVLSTIREIFWIIHGNSAVRRVLSRCVFCRRLHGRPLTQKMADLPTDRVTPDLTPFTVTGVDLFGPFYVKRGRTTVKRFGVIFVCQKSRAVHLEIVHSMTTHSFINAMRRFMARRGSVKVIRCDNGTNFVGARRELKEELRKWNQQHIEDELLQREVKWIFNAPGASHHGGTWERLIRETRKILNFMLHQHTLDDESLSTFMCEVENIINGRPITPVSDDPNDLEALTPNHLLLYRSAQPLAPGIFSEADSYSRKRWKLVQHLATQFWHRWKKEYVLSLQAKCKWNQTQRNLRENDVVLLVEPDSQRNMWKLGRVTNVYPDAKGHVRVAEVRTRTSLFKRPISKLVLMLPEEESSACRNGGGGEEAVP